MKVAIDKNTNIKLDDKREYIYVFKDEPLEELLKLNMHCIKYTELKYVDINLTDYDINCIKKTKPTEKNWDKIPKSKDYKFAIIVPNCNNDHGCYKNKTYLQNCIESILNQTYKNFKLIIVDDMSNDTSIETIKSYKDDRIVLIQNKRKRYNGGSRNVGIEYALNNVIFDYFCFLDSDDWWKDKNVLKNINNRLYDCELMLIGMELIDNNGIFMTKYHEYDNYQDFFLSDNKVWCTAWSRVIRKDKIVFFPENTIMEDRTWSYEQADNVDLDKVVNLKQPLYIWNRMNTTNSVSIVRDKVWEASAWKHIGEQKMLLTRLKHKEMIPIIEERIKHCEELIRNGTYQQF
jgi:glycosyltransferase involved in cell wall biosynthesis